MGLSELLSLIPTRMVPPSLGRFLLKMIPHRSLHTLIEIVDTLKSTSMKILLEKKAALDKGDEAIIKEVGEGKDLMSILRTS